MLQEGERIQIGESTYKVTRVPKRIYACMGMCDIRKCNGNEAFNEVKRKFKVQSCCQLIELDCCFKKVE